MPQIGKKKYPYTKEGLAKYKHDLSKLSAKKKKIQKQYGMNDIERLISLEAKMDDSFEFYAQQPYPQQKKEGSALGTAAKVGAGAAALGGAAYGGSLLMRGDKLKGGGVLQDGAMARKGIGGKLGAVKDNFKKTGGFGGAMKRAGGVFKRDKAKLAGGIAKQGGGVGGFGKVLKKAIFRR
jgi:hypothetical protein